MGLHSSYPIVSVGTSVTPLIQSKPNIIRDAVMRAILNDYNIADSILDALLGGYNVDVKSFLKKGQTDYVYGMPEGTFSYVSSSEDQIEAAIASEIGEPVTLQIDMFRGIWPDMVAKYHIQEQQNWDSVTNIVQDHRLDDIPIGSDVFYDSAHAFTKQVIDPDWDPNYSEEPYYINEIIGVSIKYYYLKGDGTQVYKERDLLYSEVDLNGGDPTKAFHHVEYIKDGDPTFKNYYWLYEPTLNRYPDIGGFDNEEFTSPFFPIVPIRNGGVFINTFKDEDESNQKKIEYESCKEMLNFLNIDIDQLSDDIAGNPDINVIDDAYILFAPNIATDDEDIQEYFYHFFKKLESTARITKAAFESYLFNPDRKKDFRRSPVNDIFIRDSEMSITLSFNYIDSQMFNGKVSDVNKVTRSYSIQEPNNKDDRDHFYENSTITFTKQLTETTYEVVTIHGPYHQANNLYPGKHVVKTLATAFGVDDKNGIGEGDGGFFIPLDYGLVINGPLNVIEAASVIYGSLTLVTYAVQITKVKWYMTSAFKLIVRIILLVVAIYSGGTTLAALAEAGVSEAATLILEVVLDLVISYGIGEALKFVASKIGGKAALIFAAIAIVAAVVVGLDVSAINQYLPTAETLMKAATSLIDATNEIVRDDFLDLQTDTTEFLKDAKEKQEELQEIYDTFAASDSINPFWIIEGDRMASFAESPDTYFTRTIHETNPGVLSLDAIGDYVDNKLTLPNIDQSIMNTI